MLKATSLISFVCTFSQGSPLPLLLDDEMASLMELGIGAGSMILVDEEN